MPTCMDCGKEYQRDSGPMVCVCSNCLNKPPKPDAYAKHGKLFVPNKAK